MEFKNKAGQVCGFFHTRTLTYHIRRKSGEHYYVKGKGYPIDTAIIWELNKLLCKRVRLVEETKRGINTYQIAFQAFFEARDFEHGEHGKQRCVPLEMWVKYDE